MSPDIVGRMRPPRLASAPASPSLGELYFDSGTDILYYWNGTAWVSGGSGSGGGGATMAARMYRNAAFPLVAGSQIVPIDAISYDTSGLASTANGRINIAVSGYYQVDAECSYASTVANQSVIVGIQKNGNVLVAQGSAMWGTVVGNQMLASVADVVQLNAGDYLQLWVSINGGTPSLAVGNAYANYLSVALLASLPGAVGATTPARAYRNTALNTSAGYNKISVDTISSDPGGNISVTNGRYTCPATGTYQVNAAVSIIAAASQLYFASIYRNGAEVTRGDRVATGVAATFSLTLNDIIQCNAGDYLELYVYDQSGAHALSTSAAENYLSVVQVGNLSATPASTACARMGRQAAFPVTTSSQKIPLVS